MKRRIFIGIACCLLSVAELYADAYSYIYTVKDPVKGGTVEVSGSSPNFTLTARPSFGWTFQQWSDGNTSNPRNVTANGDGAITYSAVFEYHPETMYAESLTNPDFGGTVSAALGACDWVLTATPATGYRFIRWSDGNTDNPRHVTADPTNLSQRIVTFTADFMRPQAAYAITNTREGNGGTVTAVITNDCENEWTLTAVPVSGWAFTQWNDGNTQNPRTVNLTQDDYAYTASFTGDVVVTEENTPIRNPVYNLIIYQGGSVSNPEDIVVTNSITYVRPAVDGANKLGHWYTFCLPFTPSHCYVEEECTDYEINSVYLSGADEETPSNPLGPGSFYLQTFSAPDGWAYIGGEGKPLKDTPYIIKFLDGSENSGLADYFTSNPTIMFVGGPQVISGTDNGTGGAPNGDYTYHVNHTLRKLTMNHVYPLNTATNMFEYDYGGPSEIKPFECYIKASTPALAAARPRFAIGRGAQQGTELPTAVETVAAPLQPLRIYDVTGRLFHTGDEPRQLPQGIWIVRQGEKNRTIVVP
ncbi:MAG: hypothetical protein IJ249_07330 [Paludibacteraceae bacterium]|nr:hypothetical protein [Paludibacteraceae bacterium]